MRSGSAGIARLLLLAFALQLAVPMLQLGGIAAQAGEAALAADLQSSLCHDPGTGAPPDGGPAAPSQVKHCIFCLPMAGDPAQTGLEPQAPVLAASPSVVPRAADDQRLIGSGPAFARSRGPPSSPRTV